MAKVSTQLFILVQYSLLECADMENTTSVGKRSANFSHRENELLIELVMEQHNVIENKQTNAISWQEKGRAWETIAENFNKQSGNIPRSIKTLRAKYDTIKKNIRKKCAEQKRYNAATGGGPEKNFLQTYEEKLLNVTRLSAEGMECMFDCDATNDVFQRPTTPDMYIEYLEEQDIPECSLREEADAPASNFSYAEMTYAPERRESNADQTQKKTESRRRNTRRKVTSERYEEVVQLKKECLHLQKQLLEEELQSTKKINALKIENLELDIQMKKYHSNEIKKN